MTSKEKEILAGIVGIAVLVGLFLVFADRVQPPQQMAEEQQAAEHPPVKPESEVKAAFPAGFPFEGGAADFFGFSRDLPEGSTEYTFTYTSKLTLAQNQTLFKNFLTENGFEIVTEETEAQKVFYFGRKDLSRLTVTIEDLSGQVLVSSSYLP